MDRKQKQDQKTHEKCRHSVLTFSGPNDITVFKDDADLVDLPAKLVARYSAKVSLSAASRLTSVTGSKDQASLPSFELAMFPVFIGSRMSSKDHCPRSYLFT